MAGSARADLASRPPGKPPETGKWLPFHSRQIYRCGARRGSVEESEKSMTRAATRVTYDGQGATPQPSTNPKAAEPRTARLCATKRRPLIGNDMHSPANANPLPTVTSIFLIGNEFHLQRAAFRRLFAEQLSKRPSGEAPRRHGFSLSMRFLNSNRVNMGN